MDPHSSARERERLVKEAAAGSVEAWQEFVIRYGGLILAVVRRHLIAETEDDIRSLYVDILEYLHDGGLAKYRHGASLVGWLAVVTRRKAMDYLRARYGRQRAPRGLERLNAFERQVLDLYFVEHMPLDVVIHALKWRDNRVGSDEVVEAIERVIDAVDPRYLRKLDNLWGARLTGGGSASLLKYLAHVRADYESRLSSSAPDQEMIEAEARELADRVRSVLTELPRRERDLLELRFERSLTAKDIARRMGYEGQRKVYTALDRVLRKIRLLLESASR